MLHAVKWCMLMAVYGTCTNTDLKRQLWIIFSPAGGAAAAARVNGRRWYHELAGAGPAVRGASAGGARTRVLLRLGCCLHQHLNHLSHQQNHVPTGEWSILSQYVSYEMFGSILTHYESRHNRYWYLNHHKPLESQNYLKWTTVFDYQHGFQNSLQQLSSNAPYAINKKIHVRRPSIYTCVPLVPIYRNSYCRRKCLR